MANCCLQLCAAHTPEGDLCGIAKLPSARDSLAFFSAMQMIAHVEDFLALQKGPINATPYRTFAKASSSHSHKKKETSMQENTAPIWNDKARSTFLVEIKYRQNASWQGQVHWAEENETLPFRSTLELLKIMDSALDANT